MRNIIFLIVIVSAISSCLSMRKETHRQYSYSITNSVLEPETQAKITRLSIDQNRITFHGCNINFANINRDPYGMITIHRFITTKKACPDDEDSKIQEAFMKVKFMDKK